MLKALKHYDGSGPLPPSVLNKYVGLNECVHVIWSLISSRLAQGTTCSRAQAHASPAPRKLGQGWGRSFPV